MVCPTCALPLPTATTVPGHSVVRCTRCGWLGEVPAESRDDAPPMDEDAPPSRRRDM